MYSLAATLNIDKSILSAAPTDGLWSDNRTDEDQIGASYDELEWAMSFNGDISSCNDRQKKVLNIYSHYNKISKHKIDPIPVCIIPKNLK